MIMNLSCSWEEDGPGIWRLVTKFRVILATVVLNEDCWRGLVHCEGKEPPWYYEFKGKKLDAAKTWCEQKLGAPPYGGLVS